MVNMAHQSLTIFFIKMTKKKIKKNLVNEANISPISIKRKLKQSTKQRSKKHPKKQLIPPKTIKLTQLTQ